MSDWIPCECCGAESVDCHHVWARSIRKDLENDINNIMAVCRECHVKFGDKKDKRDYLIEVHKKYMEQHGKKA